MHKATGLVSSYGAIELKKSYQLNFTWGILLAAAVHLGIMGGVALYQYLTRVELEDIPVITIRSVQELAPPPSRARATMSTWV